MVSGLPIGSLLIAAGPWLTVMLVLVVVSLVRFRSGAGIRGRTAGFPAQDDFHAGRSPGPLHDSRYLEQILQAELEAESAAAAQAHAAPPTPDPSARS
ncbi:MAG: hypothetical protein VKK62_03445 [Synechococcaceae cyanobacterium]|nr:hypothetical protein [Synechococcaceae cyanobacterium]